MFEVEVTCHCDCQVRIVFAEGIRRGLASGEHVTRRQRLRQRTRTISVDNTVTGVLGVRECSVCDARMSTAPAGTPRR